MVASTSHHPSKCAAAGAASSAIFNSASRKRNLLLAVSIMMSSTIAAFLSQADQVGAGLPTAVAKRMNQAAENQQNLHNPNEVDQDRALDAQIAQNLQGDNDNEADQDVGQFLANVGQEWQSEKTVKTEHTDRLANQEVELQRLNQQLWLQREDFHRELDRKHRENELLKDRVEALEGFESQHQVAVMHMPGLREVTKENFLHLASKIFGLIVLLFETLWKSGPKILYGSAAAIAVTYILIFLTRSVAVGPPQMMVPFFG